MGSRGGEGQFIKNGCKMRTRNQRFVIVDIEKNNIFDLILDFNYARAREETMLNVFA